MILNKLIILTKGQVLGDQVILICLRFFCFSSQNPMSQETLQFQANKEGKSVTLISPLTKQTKKNFTKLSHK